MKVTVIKQMKINYDNIKTAKGLISICKVSFELNQNLNEN